MAYSFDEQYAIEAKVKEQQLQSAVQSRRIVCLPAEVVSDIIANLRRQDDPKPLFIERILCSLK